MTTMQAVIGRGGRLVCEAVAAPRPGAGQALLRTLACGICGSDLHALAHAQDLAELGRRAGAKILMDPERDIVFGHEFCGEVLDYGPGADRRFKPGSKVIALPRITGPDGIETVGFSQRFSGGYGEQVCVDAGQLIAVPDGLSAAHAAMTEPFAVGAHAVARTRLDKDSVAVVIGCGPVGLAVIAALKVKGFGPIIAADFSPARRATAARMGADIVIDPAEQSPYGLWAELDVPRSGLEREIARAAGRRVANAVIFECVGVPGMIQKLIDGACAGAQIMVVGVCMQADTIMPYLALTKELNIGFSSAYTAAEFAETLDHIVAGRIDLEPIVTRVIGRDGTPQAFADLARPNTEVKIVIEPWRA